MAALQADLSIGLLVQRTGLAGNLINEALALLDQAHDEYTYQFVEVANGAVDQAIALGGVGTGELVLLISDQTITFKANGAAAGIQAKALFLNGAALTSLTVSNASGNQANVRVAILGT